MVQIIGYTSNTFDMNQKRVLHLMDTIQEFIKGYKHESDTPYIEVFPEVASELPRCFQERAYTDGVLPPRVDIPELGSVLGKNRMRGRQKDT